MKRTGEHRMGNYDATRTATGVQYWSVMQQRWLTAHTRYDISDADHAGLDDADRALIAALPEDYPPPDYMTP